MTKILVKFWLNHPDWFKPTCWIFGHKWYEISTPKDGGFLNTHICTRCGDGKEDFEDKDDG